MLKNPSLLPKLNDENPNELLKKYVPQDSTPSE